MPGKNQQAPLWTTREVALATSGKHMRDAEISGIAIDSREVAPGDLFFALAGAESDGHRFVGQALQAGAAAAVVSGVLGGVEANDPRLIWVDDSLVALNDLAGAARQRMAGMVIAVTGSAGKTGVKEALYNALSASATAPALVHRSPRSFNNHVGVPVSLARMPADTEFGIFEIGMNAPGEIGPLSRLVRPDVAMITNVGPAHAAAFANEEAIADAKAEIFEGLTAAGTAILNLDNRHFQQLSRAAKDAGVGQILSFAADNMGADVRPLRLAALATCSCMTADIDGVSLTFKVGMPGDHWIINSLGVLAAVHAVGGDLSLAGMALSSMTGLAGRGEQFKVLTSRLAFTVIDESYNANPLSMKAAIGVLAGHWPATAQGRRVAVLGDMEELGEDTVVYHEALAKDLKRAGVHVLLTLGPAMKALARAVAGKIAIQTFDDIDQLMAALVRGLHPGDLILVKGSNALGLGQVVEGLRALDEREEMDSGGKSPLVAA
ncbi:MAG: UDP-N-acetylmuramoyl-tripeptide--D-alanyl-D-alanine ligase [Proteobacteria bacterium]|nr:UDP-N-acetylmuramoyl-tripeptide--D-alanyl-D-alanine ligase [Pseudomonadota bacterium]